MTISAAWGQGDRYSLKGKVTDTASKAFLKDASVALLRAKDSILVSFTRSNSDGDFRISGLQKGSFILLVSFPDEYANFIEFLSLDSLKPEHDFGNINLSLKANLIAEVIIKANSPAVRINGDTTEFNVGSYIIRPNAKVEDVLKQLPGFEVDRNGKITAQGQVIAKVLIDGEQFFSDDPTLITQNIRADMVDKIQLFDKKSDMAVLTGMDDGKSVKTLNIKLKEDKKVGYFGKIDAGLANAEYYDQQGMINFFNKKYKLSAFETFNSIGKTGLGGSDSRRYGFAAVSSTFNSTGLLITNSLGNNNSEFWNGKYNNEGLPVSKAGGLHFDTKLKDKQTLNANYIINGLSLSGNRNTVSLNNLPSITLQQEDKSDYDNSSLNQNFDLIFKTTLDTNSTLKVSLNGSLADIKSNENYFSMSSDENNSSLYQSNRTLKNDGDLTTFNLNVLWTKALKKKGRLFALAAFENLYKHQNEGIINNLIWLGNASVGNPSNINQIRSSRSFNHIGGVNFSYKEPVNKQLSLSLNYGVGMNSGNSQNSTFDASTGILDNLNSNNFKLMQIFNQGGLSFNYKKDKHFFTLGTNINYTSLKQQNVFLNNSFRRGFFNLVPHSEYTYSFTSQNTFTLEYNGYAIQPTLEQIQDIVINTDPLNLYFGNPNLNPSFTNGFSMVFRSNKPITGQQVFIVSAFNLVSNPITYQISTDSFGKSVYFPINAAKDAINFSFYGSFSKKIDLLDLNLGIILNSTGSTFNTIINNQLLTSEMSTHSPRLSISKYLPKSNFVVNFGPDFFLLSSYTDKRISSNGSGLNAGLSLYFILPGKIEISSNADYKFKGKTRAFNQNFEVFLLNASLSKKFMKDESIKFTIKANDLLNQNTGFNRYANNNLITQTNFATIKRYVMFSLTYDFNKSFKSNN